MSNTTSKPNSITLTQRATLLALTLILAATPYLRAQTTASAPLPAQLTTATTAFLANAGLDNTDSTQAYDTFYQGLTTWNRYQLKPTPAAAELIFELSVNSMMSDVTNGSSIDNTYLRLVIRDTKTGALLWSLSESIRPAARQKTLVTNINDAAAKLLTDLKAVSSSTTAPAPQ